jgi:hypothetical protein
MKYCNLLLLVFLFQCHERISTTPNGERIARDILILASDSLAGRATGSREEKIAASYIAERFKEMALEFRGDSSAYIQYFKFRTGVHGEGDVDTALNVIGYLNNNAKTTIVIGAHYDHLGTDGQQSSLDANPSGKIHNGADDNASGVAGVLELARYFSNNQITEKSNFLFICFSGEELGLLGSKYFTEHPTIDLAAVDYMINLDMVGRLDSTKRNLFIYGTGTSNAWEPLIRQLNNGLFNITTDSSGTGPSDHTSFYLKNIPVLHFFTGSHPDYHKPSDDFDKINVSGEVDVLQFIIRIVESLDSRPKLSFQSTKNNQQGTRSQFNVTLGIMPDYAANEIKGLKVDGVTAGRPADHAGIKTGDIIIKLGKEQVTDIYDYMEALAKFNKGDTVSVIVVRNNGKLKFTVRF